MEIQPLSSWYDKNEPLIISGPCSAETEEQLMTTCGLLYDQGIRYMRAGVWKPRTRPNNFEGIGSEAFPWIKRVKEKYDVRFAVEVGNPHHVYEALKFGIDILWIGARSTVNPFTVQEIAEALKGVDVPVLVKNPINPDLALWMGAIERINNVGVKKLGAIHRGFSSYQKTKYRNIPLWQIAIELRTKLPEIPIICDPSHIGGTHDMISVLSQKALDLDYDGLMIESHYDPDNAWSDAMQQVTPERLGEILRSLKVKSPDSESEEFASYMEQLRDQIDNVDREIIEAIAARMNLARRIGAFKKENNVTVLQMDRWKEIYDSRRAWGKMMDLDINFIADLYTLIHSESIRRQTSLQEKEKEATA